MNGMDGVDGQKAAARCTERGQWAGGVEGEGCRGMRSNRELPTKARTFHIHSPPHRPLPLLPRTCDAPQPPISVDTLRPARSCEVRQRGRVRRAECRLRCPREERVDVVDLGVRLRQRDVMQPAGSARSERVVRTRVMRDRRGSMTHHGCNQSEKNSR